MPKKSTSHKSTGSHSVNGRSHKSSRSSGSTQGTSRKGSSHRSLMPGGNLTKGGCLPKTVILILPFIAIGAFLFTRF